MNTVARPRATFGVARREVPGVLIRALAMYDGFLQNVSTFGSPTITLVMFMALITALQAAQEAMTSPNVRGSATARNVRRDALWTAMQSLCTYAQGLGDALPASAAAALIESAGLVVAGVGKRAKAVLTATLTTTQGTVHLDANASLLVGPADRRKKRMFNWQVSTDGKTFTDLHGTPLASTFVVGLTPMTTYSFRVSVTVSKITGAWSQPVTLLVH